MRAVVTVAVLTAVMGCRSKERPAEPEDSKSQPPAMEQAPPPVASTPKTVQRKEPVKLSRKEEPRTAQPHVTHGPPKTRQPEAPPATPIVTASATALERLPDVPESRAGTADEVSESIAAIEGWGQRVTACIKVSAGLSSSMRSAVERREMTGKTALSELISFVAGLQGWLRSGAEGYRQGATGIRQVMIPAATKQIEAVESALAAEKDADMREQLRGRLRDSLNRVEALAERAARLEASAALLCDGAASLERQQKVYAVDLGAPLAAGECPEGLAEVESVVDAATRRFRLQTGAEGVR